MQICMSLLFTCWIKVVHHSLDILSKPYIPLSAGTILLYYSLLQGRRGSECYWFDPRVPCQSVIEQDTEPLTAPDVSSVPECVSMNESTLWSALTPLKVIRSCTNSPFLTAPSVFGEHREGHITFKNSSPLIYPSNLHSCLVYPHCLHASLYPEESQ